MKMNEKLLSWAAIICLVTLVACEGYEREYEEDDSLQLSDQIGELK